MQSESIKLRFLDAALLPAAVELDRRALGGIWTLDGYRQEFERSSSALVGLVKYQGQDINLLGMGCLWGIDDEAHIILLAVDPVYHRQGFGQLLLWGMLAIASQRNLTRATLEVRASNQAALSLYQKFEFQIAGQRKGYYSETDEDALILWLGKIQTPAFQQNLKDQQCDIKKRMESYGFNLSFDIKS
ncbi:Ribosomal-protein-alanine acetyltransferase [Acaryochloris thomasi RCC1774]|uniref:Ribosomal-protein-alanine acetyltransferase n=1 Tax=Acaryochloris thomasi RCC1774 TaxID=1764569 RepID=A0A2W1JPG8_9CYAN|nr:ribosomal protein S18-alanine N-acetyltransferase [Acaryochloris thomasi]PZD73315.1 Ribosomal-protein-alanine acetyltransferase [Acaryochloris thomasi RCC1774]